MRIILFRSTMTKRKHRRELESWLLYLNLMLRSDHHLFIPHFPLHFQHVFDWYLKNQIFQNQCPKSGRRKYIPPYQEEEMNSRTAEYVATFPMTFSKIAKYTSLIQLEVMSEARHIVEQGPSHIRQYRLNPHDRPARRRKGELYKTPHPPGMLDYYEACNFVRHPDLSWEREGVPEQFLAVRGVYGTNDMAKIWKKLGKTSVQSLTPAQSLM